LVSQNAQTKPAFDAQERAWLKQELTPQCGVSPVIADGFLLKVWKSGPLKGNARLSPPVVSMVRRNLLVVRATAKGQRAFLTPDGLRELTSLFTSTRLLDLAKFGDLHLQLDRTGGHKDEEVASAGPRTKATHKSTP